MSRRRKSSTVMDVFFYLIYFYVLFMVFMIKVVFKILTFFVSMIIFYTSGYKKKSGNGFFKTYFDKGTNGEYKLYRKVKKLVGEENVLTNIYLPSKNIDNTEIDVLCVNNGNIYCFEMKNYGGYIYGRAKQSSWTQVLKYRTKNSFYNPIRQNYAHQKALEEFLGVNSDVIIPIVVFSNNANLDNVDAEDNRICKLNSLYLPLPKSIDEVQKELDKALIDKLSTRVNMSEIVKKEHIEQIEMMKR